MRSKSTDSNLRPALNATTKAPPLVDLLARARALTDLDQRVRQQLPAELARHLVVANVRDHALIVLTPHPAVARQVRLEQKRILEAANRFVTEPLRTLTVKVTPPAAGVLPGAIGEHPSPAAVEHLRLAALALGDPELAAAFAKLSQKD